MSKLTKDEKEFVQELEAHISSVQTHIDNAKQFSIGDYVIRNDVFYDDNEKRKLSPERNGYGTPVKYKVVHVDANGIGYVKRVSSKGNTTGRLMCMLGFSGDDFYTDGIDMEEWTLDPDYADAVILQNKEGYDPVKVAKEKSELWKAISVHNKSAKIDTQNMHELNKLFSGLTSGDVLWTSAKNRLVITNVAITTKAQLKSFRTWNRLSNIKGQNVAVLTLTDSKGNTKIVTAEDYWQKALYKLQPRTYNELKDLNL